MAGSERAVNMHFDWNRTKDIVIDPGYIHEAGMFNRDARVIKQVQVSPPPTRLKEISVSDVVTNEYGISFQIKWPDLLLPGSRATDEVCITAQTERDEWVFIPLKEHFDEIEIAELRQWTNAMSDLLSKIGTEFEKYNRQAHHFLYEILALWHAFKGISALEKTGLLSDTRTALNIHHNRILAEVVAAYRQSRASVTLHPARGESCPDLSVDGVFVDVKTIITADVDRQAMTENLARKIDEIVDSERSSKQIGSDGTYIVGVWSSVANSVFRAALDAGVIKGGGFDYNIHKVIPRMSKNKMIFSIPTDEAFQNTYVEFNRSEAVDMVKFLGKSGLKKIDESETKKYFLRTNVRRGCTYGVSSDYPAIYFKVR